jgi:hypothetical protein
MTTSTSPLTVAEKVAEAELAYYRQANELVFRFNEMLAWYAALVREEKVEADRISVSNWKRLSSLRRYILEERGYKMLDYMALYLTPAELLYWVDEQVKPTGLLPYYD